MLLLPATLTSREAADTLGLLTQALRREGSEAPVLIDATPLQHLDSSALAVLLELERLAQAWGRPFVVRNAPPRLASLARLYGVETILFGAGAVAAPAQDQRSPVT